MRRSSLLSLPPQLVFLVTFKVWVILAIFFSWNADTAWTGTLDQGTLNRRKAQYHGPPHYGRLTGSEIRVNLQCCRTIYDRKRF